MRIDFTNAVVEDDGYGVEVNGRSLEAIISTALGTRLGDKGGYSSGLPKFKANSCDVTVIITPHPTECTINTNSGVWHSVKEMEAEKSEQFQKENAETDPEE
jgi:hypothetical protein|nr:MAG: hypothetical protein [Bacteriophage sp.]